MRDYLLEPHKEIFDKVKIPKKVKSESSLVEFIDGRYVLFRTNTPYAYNNLAKKVDNISSHFLYDLEKNSVISISATYDNLHSRIVDFIFPTEQDKIEFVTENYRNIRFFKNPSNAIRIAALESSSLLSFVHGSDFWYQYTADELYNHYLLPKYKRNKGSILNIFTMFFDVNNMNVFTQPVTHFIENYSKEERVKLLEYFIFLDNYIMPLIIDVLIYDVLVSIEELCSILRRHPKLCNFAKLAKSRPYEINETIDSLDYVLFDNNEYIKHLEHFIILSRDEDYD